jgi:hypothetical protein
MAITLNDLAKAYLEDGDYQKRRSDLTEKRDASLPHLQAVTQSFLQREINLKTFCPQLEKTLRAEEDWDAMGFGFMMELNKYHAETSTLAEEHLRETLRGLKGERIEEFYTFLLKERERLRQEGKSSGMIVPARRSPFLISLFAFWLDPQGQPIIYYESLRKGLHALLKVGVVSEQPGLILGPGTIEIRTAADYQAVEALVTSISQHQPQLQKDPYWIESFCLWVKDHVQSIGASTSTLVKEVDDSALLATKPTKTTVQETTPTYGWSLPQPRATASLPLETAQLIDPEPLMPTLEPLLTQLIHEVQRHILIDEATIRQIYYALLDSLA